MFNLCWPMQKDAVFFYNTSHLQVGELINEKKKSIFQFAWWLIVRNVVWAIRILYDSKYFMLSASQSIRILHQH